MDDFDDFLAEQVKDPEFRAEWEALQPELSAAQAEISTRKETVTQASIASPR